MRTKIYVTSFRPVGLFKHVFILLLAIERTSDKKLQKEEWENFERKELQTKEKKEKVSYASVVFQGLLFIWPIHQKIEKKWNGNLLTHN
jgi:hypothetical protein